MPCIMIKSWESGAHDVSWETPVIPRDCRLVCNQPTRWCCTENGGKLDRDHRPHSQRTVMGWHACRVSVMCAKMIGIISLMCLYWWYEFFLEIIGCGCICTLLFLVLKTLMWKVKLLEEERDYIMGGVNINLRHNQIYAHICQLFCQYM